MFGRVALDDVASGEITIILLLNLEESVKEGTYLGVLLYRISLEANLSFHLQPHWKVRGSESYKLRCMTCHFPSNHRTQKYMPKSKVNSCPFRPVDGVSIMITCRVIAILIPTWKRRRRGSNHKPYTSLLPMIYVATSMVERIGQELTS